VDGDPITRVGLAPRAPGLTLAAAQSHWRTEHRDLALGLPGLRSYVQNHAVLREGVPLLPYPGFDVCAETEFDSVEAMRSAFASEHYQSTVRSDEANLIDRHRFMLALTRRRVLSDGLPPNGAVKLMTFLRAHPMSDPRALVNVLAGPYAAAANEVSPLRHELLITQEWAHEGEQTPCCDVIDVLWFAQPDDALRAVLGPLSERAGWLLGGLAFGTERLIAAPLRHR
jgi:uncharacterized protein (TIGR02118 family)